MYVYTIEDFGSLRFTEGTSDHDGTEKFFSTSRLADTKNGRTGRHDNKLPPPPPHLSIVFGKIDD